MTEWGGAPGPAFPARRKSGHLHQPLYTISPSHRLHSDISYLTDLPPNYDLSATLFLLLHRLAAAIDGTVPTPGDHDLSATISAAIPLANLISHVPSPSCDWGIRPHPRVL